MDGLCIIYQYPTLARGESEGGVYVHEGARSKKATLATSGGVHTVGTLLVQKTKAKQVEPMLKAGNMAIQHKRRALIVESVVLHHRKGRWRGNNNPVNRCDI